MYRRCWPSPSLRSFATTAIKGVANLTVRITSDESNHYKLLVVGGGAGGATMANKFAGRLGANQVAVLDAAQKHYYQPGFTLVGGGMKSVDWTCREQKDVLSKNVKWIQQMANEFRCVAFSLFCKP